MRQIFKFEVKRQNIHKWNFLYFKINWLRLSQMFVSEVICLLRYSSTYFVTFPWINIWIHAIHLFMLNSQLRLHSLLGSYLIFYEVIKSKRKYGKSPTWTVHGWNENVQGVNCLNRHSRKFFQKIKWGVT